MCGGICLFCHKLTVTINWDKYPHPAFTTSLILLCSKSSPNFTLQAKVQIINKPFCTAIFSWSCVMSAFVSVHI